MLQIKFMNKISNLRSRYFKLVIALVMSIGIFGMTNNPIPYQKITWKDFKGEIDPNSDFYAMTWWFVNYQYNGPRFIDQKALIDIKVTYGLKNNSWYKPDKISDQLLNHEQGHLNIAYLLALDLRNIFLENTYNKSNYKSKIDSIYKNTEAKYLKMELLYDKDTRHMYDTKAQKRWDIFFNNEAKRLIAKNNQLN